MPIPSNKILQLYITEVLTCFYDVWNRVSTNETLYNDYDMNYLTVVFTLKPEIKLQKALLEVYIW